MNILIVNAGKGWGGIESHSVTLSLALQKRGHSTIIACSEDGHVYLNAADAGLPLSNVKVLNACDLISILKILRLASREKIDMIVANLGKEYWPSTIAAKLGRKKIIFVRHQRDPIRKTTRWLMNNHVDMVVAVSTAVSNALRSSDILSKKILVIHNAISLSRFDLSRIDRGAVRRELGIAESDSVVGIVGKLHEGKGVYELLRAVNSIAKEFNSVKLLFVGDGPERDGIIKEAGRMGLTDNIIITGIRQDVQRMYAAMDIFALPSHNEGMPTVLIEAMAMKIPVIATPVGGVPEIIHNGENGLLVLPGDEKGLSDAIRNFMTDKRFAARIGAKGRQTVESEFSEDMLGERFEKMFFALGIK